MNALPLWKNKRFQWSITLGFLLVLQVVFFAYLKWYKIPEEKKILASVSQELQVLENQKNELHDTSGITEILGEYEEKSEILKVFQENRNNVFYFVDEEKFDFFPPLVDVVIPAVTKHIHGEVTLEGISINEEAEVILPMYAKSYTHLAKQYAAIKYAFESEAAPLFTNIKLNTFTRQELEIIDKNDRGQFTKRREKVIKATVVAQINPEYFVKESSDTSFESEEFESFFGNQKKENIFKKTIRVTSTTAKNIKLSTLALIERIQAEIEAISEPKTPQSPKTTTTEPSKEEITPEAQEDSVVTEETEVEESAEMTTETETQETSEETAETQEEVKEIITTAIPSFQLNGITWSRVPAKMSEFLAAGKTLVVGEISISPYQSYSEEELTNTAIEMMNALTNATGTVTFHQKDFDVNSSEEDVINLVELNQ